MTVTTRFFRFASIAILWLCVRFEVDTHAPAHTRKHTSDDASYLFCMMILSKIVTQNVYLWNM